MFTKFHTVGFETNDVAGVEVDGTDLYIEMHSRGKVYHLSFETPAQAEAAQAELINILNGDATPSKPTSAKTDEVLKVAKDTVESLQGVIDSLRTKATNKVAEVAIQSFIKDRSKKIKDDLSSRASEFPDVLELLKSATEDKSLKDFISLITDLPDSLGMFGDSSEVKDPVHKKAPEAPVHKKAPESSEAERKPNDKPSKPTSCFTDILSGGIFTAPTPSATVNVTVTDSPVEARDLTLDQFKLVFGTVAEPLIGDLRQEQLKVFISNFIDDALTNERVQTLFASIKKQFSPEQADKAVEGYKNLILSVCLDNTEITLSEVISRFFS